MSTTKITKDTKNINQIEKVLQLKFKKLKSSYLEYVANKKVSKLMDELETEKSKFTQEELIRREESRKIYPTSDTISIIEGMLENKFMIMYNEAKIYEEHIDAKILNLADKLYNKFDVKDSYLLSKGIRDIVFDGYNIEFIINYDDKFNIHGRSILAMGEIQKPHIRFITTKKAI